jgi:hypothetical protein
MIRREEDRLHYELGSLAVRLSARIIEGQNGTLTEKQARVSEVTAMCAALQRAVLDGGRKAYDEELAGWKNVQMYEEFQSGLDSAMTRMPSPRERLAEQD